MRYLSRRQMIATHRHRPRKLQKKWTIEEDKIMVQMIEERPAIWNFSSPEYRNRDTKKKCWMDVAESTNHSVVDAKNHWNTVKSRFNLERKKDLQFKSRHSGETFSSSYELYELLQFLATLESRPPRRTTTHLVMEDESHEHDFEDSRSTVTTPSTSNRDVRARRTTSSSTKQKLKRLTSPVPIQNRKLTHLLSEIVDIVKSRQEVTPAKRWKKAFLEYISCELDRYEDYNAQRLKNEILSACMNFQPEPCVVMESHYVE